MWITINSLIKLTGGCHGCSTSKTTIKKGIENCVKNAFPSITEVVDMTDHTTGENPYQ
jgi:Fe/S biogenesis protein NfuA